VTAARAGSAAAEGVPAGNRAAIATRDLVCAYGTVRAVDAVTFSVEQGEVFGLLGPNGAGKTTTIKVLTTLLRPESGSAQILGLDTHPGCHEGAPPPRVRSPASCRSTAS
jgi:ABC-2 type transport system ATP-binding protein